jgi:CubicO group peptidase (beta-lactamase class C family)
MNNTTKDIGILLPQLRAIVDHYEADRLFSGALLVTRGGRELLAEARGLAHRGFSVPNTLDTRFDTASVGKLLTAVAAFRLADRGILGLDEVVRDIVHLEDTKIPADVTLRHCLSHTSGIADDADEEAGEDYEAIWKTKPCYLVRETADFLPQFAYKEPLFPAGTKSRYNNCAYVLVGLVLEKRTGHSFREIIDAEVFGPAGMTGAGYFAKDGVEPLIAEGYATVHGAEGEVRGFRKNIFAYPPIGSPDAGAFVTVRDLARLFAAIESDGLLSAASRAEILRPVIDATALEGGGLRRYGYALEYDFDPSGRLIRYGKDGINPGVAAIVMRYPAADGLVAILANQDANVWSMCRDLARTAGFAPPAGGGDGRRSEEQSIG